MRCASPRASEVLPVPGGPTRRITPCSGMTLRSTFPRSVKFSIACERSWLFQLVFQDDRIPTGHRVRDREAGAPLDSLRPVEIIVFTAARFCHRSFLALRRLNPPLADLTSIPE